MIPILYTPFETAFTSNGIGRLADCISCTVTEERNGIFECEFEYPISGKFYNTLINQGGIVGVIHDDNHDIQPFEIYRHSDPIDGIVTFNAHHISYALGNVIVGPFVADTCADALQGMVDNAITPNPFSFWTDKPTSGTFTLTHPDNVRALLCGQQGSILDVYGTGEYEFDKYTVKLYAHRGLDRGVTIRYGKNLADIEREYDESEVFNAITPYWADQDGNVVMLPEPYVYVSAGALFKYPWEEQINGPIMTDGSNTEIDFQPFRLRTVPLDMSSEFQEQPTVAQLRTAAMAYLTNNEPWIPKDNIKVNFVQLWQTSEYENVAALQRVSLCDTVAIYYPELGVTNASAKVIRIVYNVLTERYDEMELGEPKATLADTIAKPLEAQIENVYDESVSFTEEAVRKATDLITGGLGGYVVMNLNAEGKPQEILIMDTPDINTAVNVIRMNQNGIGFSQTGYEGPFTSAWTIDGAFNADFITAGTMLANRIYGGTLTVGGMNNQSGVIIVRGASNNEIGRWNNGGIRMNLNESGNDYALFNKNGMALRVKESTIQTYPSEMPADPDDWAGTGTTIDIGLLENYVNYNGYSYNVSIAPDGITMGYSGNDTRFIQIRTGGGLNRGGIKIDYNDTAAYLYYFIKTGGLEISGDFTGHGAKSRLVETEEYSDRLLYCYETPTPMFGDIGEGVIDETGYCYVFLDPIFAETISTRQYQVFLQKYGEGDCWVSERKAGYFVVQGTGGMSFGWELKAKQKGYDQLRLEKKEELDEPLETDYGELAAQYLEELEEGRQVA